MVWRGWEFTRHINTGRHFPASYGIFQGVLLLLKKKRRNSKGHYHTREISQEEVKLLKLQQWVSFE